MKTLKKTLCLVLAVVMVVGVMVIPANAADYKDYDEIEYKEAVDVLSGLGVIDGLDTGNFKPDGTLTREQAAKIVATMLLGPTNAEKLGKNQAIFTDVAAGRWSAGYIAYCAQQGILAGVGGGRFNPSGELTEAAFGKMLLVALGYDAEQEGYLGNAWEINVATDMIDAGIDVAGTVISDTITREQAAQMAFQTLTATMVEYTGRRVEVNGVVIEGNPATEIEVNNEGRANYCGYGKAGDGTRQFCEKYFPKLTLSDDVDDFYRPANVWKNGRDTIAFAPSTASYTLEGAVNGGKLYSTVGSNAARYDWAIYEDGVLTAKNESIVKRNNDTDVAGAGAVTDIFVDDEAETVIATVINTYVATVATVVGEGDVKDGESPYITLADLSGIAGFNNKFETEAFAKDDVVRYTYSKAADVDAIETVALADSESGEVTRFTSSKVTMDGVAYSYSAKKSDPVTAIGDYTLYLDTQGNILYAVPGVITKELAYVISMGYTTDQYGSNNEVYYGKLLLTDGSVVSVELGNKAADLTVTGSAKAKSGAVAENMVVQYSVSDNVYTLYAISSSIHGELGNSTPTTQVNIDTGVSKMTVGNQTVYADSKTIFLVKNGSKYDVYTGIASVPSLDGVQATGTDTHDGTFYATDATTSSGTKAAKVVYIGSGKAVDTGVEDVVFVLGVASPKQITEKSGSASVSYYEYSAVVDGEAVTLKVRTTTTLVTSGLNKGDVIVLTGYEVDNDGFVTKVNLNSDNNINDDGRGTKEATGVKKVSNDTLELDSTRYTCGDDIVVVTNDGTSLSVSTLSAIKDDTDATVNYVVYKNAIIAICITPKVEGAGSSSPVQTVAGYTASEVAGNEMSISVTGTTEMVEDSVKQAVLAQLTKQGYTLKSAITISDFSSKKTAALSGKTASFTVTAYDQGNHEVTITVYYGLVAEAPKITLSSTDAIGFKVGGASGKEVTATGTVSDGGTISYKWKIAGNDFDTNGTSAKLDLNTATASGKIDTEGAYTVVCEVTNTLGDATATTTSEKITVVVFAAQPISGNGTISNGQGSLTQITGLTYTTPTAGFTDSALAGDGTHILTASIQSTNQVHATTGTAGSGTITFTRTHTESGLAQEYEVSLTVS